MTTRLKGLTVVLDYDIREDDAQLIIDAISMIKGVLMVKPIECETNDWMIESKVKMELRSKILDILKP